MNFLSNQTGIKNHLVSLYNFPKRKQNQHFIQENQNWNIKNKNKKKSKSNPKLWETQMRNQPTSKVPKSNRIKQQSEHNNSIGPGFSSQHSLRKSYTFIERSETHLSSYDDRDAETSARKKGGWERRTVFLCVYIFICVCFWVWVSMKPKLCWFDGCWWRLGTLELPSKETEVTRRLYPCLTRCKHFSFFGKFIAKLITIFPMIFLLLLLCKIQKNH